MSASVKPDARSGGSQSIFEGKTGERVQGVLTPVGTTSFENARKRLAKMAGRETASDGDTIIYLSIGERETQRYLHDKEQRMREA